MLADWELAVNGQTPFAIEPLPTHPRIAIILAVVHPEFLQLGAAGIHALGKPGMCSTT